MAEPQDPSRPKPVKQAISYAAERVIGSGSFGVVYQATVLERYASTAPALAAAPSLVCWSVGWVEGLG